jgi:hypothetical protein
MIAIVVSSNILFSHRILLTSKKLCFCIQSYYYFETEFIFALSLLFFSGRYMARGVSASKEDVHAAIANVSYIYIP